MTRSNTTRRGGHSTSSATTAANDSCHPGSDDDARVERERHRRCEADRVPARRRSPGERRHEPGRPHHPGPLDRRSAARQRHVGGDERERQQEPRTEREPRHARDEQDEDAEQHHVLTGDRQQVGEPRPLEVGAHLRVEPLVLAEDHAPQQRGLAWVQPVLETALRATADGVEQAGHAAATAAGPAHRRRVDRGAGPTRPLVGVVAPQRSDAPRHRDHLPHSGPRARMRARTSPHHGHLAVQPRTAQADAGDGGPRRALADGLEHRRGHRHRAARERNEPCVVGSVEPALRDRGAAHDAGSRQQCERQRRHPARQRGPSVDPAQHHDRHGHCGGDHEHRGARHGREQQAAHDGEQHDVPRMAQHHGRGRGELPADGRHPYTRTCSRSEARRVSPIPGTWSSSSTDPKPSCSSR